MEVVSVFKFALTVYYFIYLFYLYVVAFDLLFVQRYYTELFNKHSIIFLCV